VPEMWKRRLLSVQLSAKREGVCDLRLRRTVGGESDNLQLMGPSQSSEAAAADPGRCRHCPRGQDSCDAVIVDVFDVEKLRLGDFSG
jgi:hypothetical protein